MTPGGQLAAEIVVTDGVISEAKIVSSRRIPLAKLLRGKPVNEAVALVPLLFATCGVAHAVAATSAVSADPSVLSGDRAWARSLLVESEIIDGHAWAVLADWPRVIGEAPATKALRDLRSATAALSHAVDPARDALRLEACKLHPSHDALAAALDAIDTNVGALVEGLPNDLGELRAWCNRSPSPAARFVAHVLDEASVGASDIALLPALDARWLSARLGASATFGERPTIDGVPHEAGALARAIDTPLVASVVARHGRGALARIVARLIELAASPARIRAKARARDVLASDAHDGCGIAETARGRLAHWARIEDGKVVDWRFVAPTEWTFHPDGAFSRGLVGARVASSRRAVELHVAALDPCVPCALAFSVGAG